MALGVLEGRDPMRTLPPSELDVEQEVDVRRLGSTVATHWWLPLAGILVGALAGLLLSLGGGSFYRAEATIFLGQPFTPGGGGQITSLATSLDTAAQIVRSEAALRAAARASGIPVQKLRGRVSAQAATSTAARRVAPVGVNQLVEVSVQGTAPLKTERAANALAQRVTGAVGGYVEQKLIQLRKRIANSQRSLRDLNRRLRLAQQQQAAVARNDEGLAPVERLILLANANTTLNFLDLRLATVQGNLFAALDQLALAEFVEQSRVVEPAVAVKTAARSTRTSLLVGAALGLLLGILAALFLEPITARFGRRSAL